MATRHRGKREEQAASLSAFVPTRPEKSKRRSYLITYAGRGEKKRRKKTSTTSFLAEIEKASSFLRSNRE